MSSLTVFSTSTIQLFWANNLSTFNTSFHHHNYHCIPELLSFKKKRSRFQMPGVFLCYTCPKEQPQSLASTIMQSNFISQIIVCLYRGVRWEKQWVVGGCVLDAISFDGEHNKSVSSKKKIVQLVKWHYPASSNMFALDGSRNKMSVLKHNIFPLWVKETQCQKRMLKMSFAFLLISQIQHQAYAPYLILAAALL